MRQIIITCPASRSNEVVDLLQGECKLAGFVSRSTEDGISVVTALVHAEASGIVMHELDLIGCGVAWGRLELVAVAMAKPLRPAYMRLTDKGVWKQQLFNAFKDSATARMSIEEIYHMVDAGAGLSVDFLLYILIAAIISTLGLITNNTVMIVASMLLSPLMGPILGFSLGTVLRDKHLIVTGIIAELVGVFATFMVGFTMGLIVSGWPQVPHLYDWPTGEMSSRGEVSNLLLGFFFAVPSGVGVALSCTQGGVNLLVGVAIAASLLPPICNTGLNLAFASVGARLSSADPDDEYNQKQYFRIAGVSFLLFLINVATIYVTCILLFLLKRIHPVRRKTTKYAPAPSINTRAPGAGTGMSGALSAPAALSDAKDGGGRRTSLDGRDSGGSGKMAATCLTAAGIYNNKLSPIVASAALVADSSSSATGVITPAIFNMWDTRAAAVTVAGGPAVAVHVDAQSLDASSGQGAGQPTSVFAGTAVQDEVRGWPAVRAAVLDGRVGTAASVGPPDASV